MQPFDTHECLEDRITEYMARFPDATVKECAVVLGCRKKDVTTVLGIHHNVRPTTKMVSSGKGRKRNTPRKCDGCGKLTNERCIVEGKKIALCPICQPEWMNETDQRVTR